ncbi:MAG TPA: EAL domain-containing protein [Pseudolabrys sp.]|nr:EAL domain-containing protein [Pseudolabrys sp.]
MPSNRTSYCAMRTWRFMTPGPTARDVPLLRARDEYAHESAAGARNGPAQGPRRRTVRALLPAPRRIGNERGGGFEALLRWNHPMRRLVSPADFIPIAEETGLIVPLGEWVLKAVCAEAVNWPEHIKVAVNPGAAQLPQSRQHGHSGAARIRDATAQIAA